MKQTLADFIYAVLAGAAIAIGGTIYLSLDNKIVGAMLFTVGLFAVCVNGFNLFTGKVAYVFDNKPRYLLFLLNCWVGNLLGAWLVAALLSLTRVGAALTEKAAGLCDVKLADSALSVFLLGIFCNMLVCLAVDGFRFNQHELGKYIGLFLGVSVFILCGFEHCVANMFYFSMGGAWSVHTFIWLLLMTAGNAVGGVVLPGCRKLHRALMGEA